MSEPATNGAENGDHSASSNQPTEEKTVPQSSNDVNEREGSRSRSRSKSPAARDRSRSPRGSRSRSRSPRDRSRSPRSPSPRDNRRARRSSRSKSPAPRGGRGGTQPTPEPSKVLGVFGLSSTTTRDDLEDEFAQYGKIEKVDLIVDKDTGRSRCFAFIYFDNMDDAIKARESGNGMKLHGRSIRIDFSMTKRAHSPTPGQYMGRVRRRDRERGGRDGGRDRDRDRRGDRVDRYVPGRYSPSRRRDYSPRGRYEPYDDRYYRERDRYDDRDRYYSGSSRGGDYY